MLAICPFREAIVVVSEFTWPTSLATSWLRLDDTCASWFAAELKSEARAFAAARTLCRVAVSEGSLVSADSELKNELISVPRCVELTDVDVELKPKIFCTCCKADSSAPLCA